MLTFSGQRSQACYPTFYNAQSSQTPTTNHYLTLTAYNKGVKKAFSNIRSCPFQSSGQRCPTRTLPTMEALSSAKKVLHRPCTQQVSKPILTCFSSRRREKEDPSSLPIVQQHAIGLFNIYTLFYNEQLCQRWRSRKKFPFSSRTSTHTEERFAHF